MTTGNINRMIEMRTNGATIQQIADKFGVSKQYIHTLIPRFNHQIRKPNYSVWVYPEIAEYCECNNLGISDIENEFGIAYSAFYNIMTGKCSPRKTTIDKILKATLMKYEEAFKTKEELK